MHPRCLTPVLTLMGPSAEISVVTLASSHLLTGPLAAEVGVTTAGTDCFAFFLRGHSMQTSVTQPAPAVAAPTPAAAAPAVLIVNC
jgi:hypothetical protein